MRDLMRPALRAAYEEELDRHKRQREEYYASLTGTDEKCARLADALWAQSWEAIKQANVDAILYGRGEAIDPMTGSKIVFEVSYNDGFRE